MPEVAGQAALLVNPNNPKELKEAMHEICRDEKLRARLSEKGLIRASGFSWQKTASEFIKYFDRKD